MLSAAFLADVSTLKASDRIAEGTTDQEEWQAGRFFFSDERGGFKILSVSGTGSRADPIILRQAVMSVEPSIITIRLPGAAKSFDFASTWASLHLRLETVNESRAGWIGYRLELQEAPGEPSIYGDGLSFNQVARDSSTVRSDRFARHEVEYEPGDRMVFTEGFLDPRDTVQLNVFVVDLTPNPIFFIEQRPQLPGS